jgi:hypothetical protein
MSASTHRQMLKGAWKPAPFVTCCFSRRGDGISTRDLWVMSCGEEGRLRPSSLVIGVLGFSEIPSDRLSRGAFVPFSEVMVNGPDDVYVERNGRIELLVRNTWSPALVFKTD